MKNLIMISGTMGVGKTTICRELQKLLPCNVFLDGDWCWEMKPFVVNEETKAMVIKNICFLLNQFLKCSQYDNIIFCWVMDEQAIIDSVIKELSLGSFSVKFFSLVADKASLIKRLQNDINCGIRDENIIEKSISRLKNYASLNTIKIDVSNINPNEAAHLILQKLQCNNSTVETI